MRYHNWRHAFNVGQMMFAILVVSLSRVPHVALLSDPLTCKLKSERKHLARAPPDSANQLIERATTHSSQRVY